MFKRVLNLFNDSKVKPGNSDQEVKASLTEEGSFSFLGLKIVLKNPSWKTMVFAVIFLVAVIVIIKYLPAAIQLFSK